MTLPTTFASKITAGDFIAHARAINELRLRVEANEAALDGGEPMEMLPGENDGGDPWSSPKQYSDSGEFWTESSSDLDGGAPSSFGPFKQA